MGEDRGDPTKELETGFGEGVGGGFGFFEEGLEGGGGEKKGRGKKGEYGKKEEEGKDNEKRKEKKEKEKKRTLA